MRKLMFLSSFVLSLGALSACGNKAGDAMVAKMEDYKKQACACKDTACATAVMEDMGKYATAHANDRGTQKQIDQVSKITTEMSECMTKLATMATPPPVATPDPVVAPAMAGSDGSAAPAMAGSDDDGSGSAK